MADCVAKGAGRGVTPTVRCEYRPKTSINVATLRYRLRCRGPGGDQLRHPSEVLSDGCQHELVLRAARASKPKTAEAEDALQMREPHLDAFAVAS